METEDSRDKTTLSRMCTLVSGVLTLTAHMHQSYYPAETLSVLISCGTEVAVQVDLAAPETLLVLPQVHLAVVAGLFFILLL